MRKIVTLVAFIAFAPASALAEERATTEVRATTKDAEMLVHEAIAFLKKEGKERALAEFSNPKGRFTYRDLYIYVLDMDGVVRAHGTKKELIGRNMQNAKDVDGKYFSRDQVELAKLNGSGWTQYKFENPATGNIERKIAFVERVGDLIIGCGAFKR